MTLVLFKHELDNSHHILQWAIQYKVICHISWITCPSLKFPDYMIPISYLHYKLCAQNAAGETYKTTTRQWFCQTTRSLSSDGLFCCAHFQEYKVKLAKVTQVRKELRSRLNSLPGLYNSSNWLKCPLRIRPYPPATETSTPLLNVWLVTLPYLESVCVPLYGDLWFCRCLQKIIYPRGFY